MTLDPSLLLNSLGDVYYRGSLYDRYADDGVVRIFPTYPEWELPADPTWSEDPEGSVTWRVYYHGLTWLETLAWGHDNAGYADFVDDAKALIFDYFDTVIFGGGGSPDALNDFASARRITTLDYLYHQYLKDALTPAEDQTFREAMALQRDHLGDLIASGRWAENNHGLTHALSLYDLTQAFPDLDPDGTWRDMAIDAAITAINGMAFVEDGVSTEQSIYYHYYAIDQFLEAEGYFSDFGQDLPIDFKALIAGMAEFELLARFADDKMAPLGDTRYDANAATNLTRDLYADGVSTPYIDYIMTGGRSGERPPEFVLKPDAGYALFRHGEYAIDGDAQSSRLIFDFGPQRISHGHEDALNFVLNAHGENLIVDSGGPYLYDGGLLRQYFLQAKAHNTVIVDGDGYAGGAELRGAGTGDGYAWAAGAHDNYAGIVHARTIVDLGLGASVVLDRFDDGGAVHNYDLLYHLDPAAKIAASPDMGPVNVTVGDVGMRLTVHASAPTTRETIAGRLGDDPQGLVTKIAGTYEAAPVLSFKQDAADAWFVTTIDTDVGQPAESFSHAARSADVVSAVYVTEGQGWAIAAGDAVGVARLGAVDVDSWNVANDAGALTYGEDGADWFLSGAGDDVFYARSGDDVFVGSDGGDYFHGSFGRDTAIYIGVASGVDVDLAVGVASSADWTADDQLYSVENVYGSTRNDAIFGDDQANWLFGGAGDDRLLGRTGDDVLAPGAGADRIDGGDGHDELSYADAVARLIVRLYEGAGAAGDAAGDRIANIEVVVAGSGDDFVAGDTQANLLIGGDGNDILRGGSGDDTLLGGEGDDILRGQGGDDLILGDPGADDIDGGEGFDVLQYSGAAIRVVARLWEGFGEAGDAAGDYYIAIEGVTGGAGDDFIAGGIEDNLLDGGVGDDILRGGSGHDRVFGGLGDDIVRGQDGDDTLYGGRGDDLMEGGEGDDIFVIARGDGHDEIIDFDVDNADRLDLTGFGFNGFADVQALMRSTEAGVRLDLDGATSVLLTGVAAETVGPADVLI